MLTRAGTRYSAAIFLGSALLFLIEFVSAKRLLPLLGGGAAVWIACLVFFQSALLLGYWAAHWLVTRLAPRRQAIVYVAFLAISLGQLAFAVRPQLHPVPSHPVMSVLVLLVSLVGVPFLTLAATSPLLQSWYARDAGSAGAYRLYSLSNVGSLLALVSYPLLLEPTLSLRQQSIALIVGFLVFALLVTSIAAPLMKLQVTTPVARPVGARVRPLDAALWIALATCGSLLLAAVTTYISQNVATIPLLWIAPLMAYLLSFVVAFSGERWLPREAMVALGAVGLGAAYYFLSRGILSTPLLLVVIGFCVSLFLICLFLHAELYRRRPPEHQLTSFYSCLATGGALGAILVGVVAPSVLDGNYELAFGLTLAAALGTVVIWDFGALPRIVALGVTTGMASLVLTQLQADRASTLVRVRNFYGALHVMQMRDTTLGATARTLHNGAISHGRQVFRSDLAHEPNSYYGRKSGVGYAIGGCCGDRPRRIGVIGLGAGTIAAYGRAGDHIRFYDINPAVETIARTQFAFLRGSEATTDVIIGDARVSMAAEPPQRYDVIVVDAFSGDAIPVHLITAEALALYQKHLAPDGIIAFHVSNRHLTLQPVVAQLAAHAGMSATYISNPPESARDVWSSDWVLVTRNVAFTQRTDVARASTKIDVPADLRFWTDDYNSLLPILKLRH